MPIAKKTVPIPAFPPNTQPNKTTVISIIDRTDAIGFPVTLCKPVISPSRGPGPKLAGR